MRKICIVTGSRAEYGLLCQLMNEINADPELELQIAVTGAHLSPEYGLSYKKIEADGFTINEKVEMLVSSDTAPGMAKSLGLAIIGFADAFKRLQPDILVLLGDRYEIMGTALAAMPAVIPIAHISGGEITEGSIDDAIRHSITKIAHLHFVANENYRQRVIQLGENPARVFNYGDPALDNIRKLPLLSRHELEQEINFKLGRLNFLVAYHPVTLIKRSIDLGLDELLAALDDYPHARIIITGSNADTGGWSINNTLQEYAGKRQNKVIFIKSMGQLRFLSAIKHCQLMIGNSSSAIVEAPALKTPAINIGLRQEGRLKAASIIDCREDRQDIKAAIDLALSPDFQKSLSQVQSLYGDCNASYRIKETLKSIDLNEIVRKKFYDIEFKY